LRLVPALLPKALDSWLDSMVVYVPRQVSRLAAVLS
jgi:hypothetical protein